MNGSCSTSFSLFAWCSCPLRGYHRISSPNCIMKITCLKIGSVDTFSMHTDSSIHQKTVCSASGPQHCSTSGCHSLVNWHSSSSPQCCTFSKANCKYRVSILMGHPNQLHFFAKQFLVPSWIPKLTPSFKQPAWLPLPADANATLVMASCAGPVSTEHWSAHHRLCHFCCCSVISWRPGFWARYL